jgi:hypothetical protein
MTGHGYAVYSEASEGIAADHRVFFTAPGPAGMEKGDIECKLLDAMLYCEECADALFTEKVWKDAKALRVDIAAEDVNGAEGKEARFEVIDFSIALRAKRGGLTPPEARHVAHILGEQWRKDPSATKLQLAEDSRLNGLRGWLVLVGLGLVVSAIISLYGLWTDLPFLRDRIRLLNAHHPEYNGSLVDDEILFLIFFNVITAVFLAGLVYLNILFFKKKKTFPKFFIVFLVFYFAVSLLMYWANPSGELRVQSALAGTVGMAFLQGIVWVSYFLSSRRVKATFVR